jgi:hypothetical protein
MATAALTRRLVATSYPFLKKQVPISNEPGCLSENLQEIPDSVARLDRMAQAEGLIDLVAIAAPLFRAHNGAGLLEVRQDALDRSLRYADKQGEASNGGFRVAFEADQSVAVVGEKCPLRP